MKYKINPKYRELENWLVHLPENFEITGKAIYKGRNEIKVFEQNCLQVNVKSFKIPHLINKIAYAWLRGSKAKHSYEYAMKMINCGANTPEPVAYLEVLKNGLFKKSFYVSCHYEYDLTIRDLIGVDYPDKNNILKQFAAFTYNKFHENRIHHLDYSSGNILIKKLGDSKYDFSIVDVNRMRFEEMVFEKGLRNFSKIWASEDELQIVAQEYARINGKDEKEAVKLLIRFDKEHKAKINRKKALKAKFKKWRKLEK